MQVFLVGITSGVTLLAPVGQGAGMSDILQCAGKPTVAQYLFYIKAQNISYMVLIYTKSSRNAMNQNKIVLLPPLLLLLLYQGVFASTENCHQWPCCHLFEAQVQPTCISLPLLLLHSW